MRQIDIAGAAVATALGYSAQYTQTQASKYINIKNCKY
jgi:hypothetical protein